MADSLRGCHACGFAQAWRCFPFKSYMPVQSHRHGTLQQFRLATLMLGQYRKTGASTLLALAFGVRIGVQ